MSIRATQIDSGNRLNLTATTLKGNQVPVQLFVTEDFNTEKIAVFVFPLTSHPVCFRLEEVSDQKKITSIWTHRLTPKRLKWSSRFNYRFKLEKCKVIRDIDSIDYYKHATINVEECIPSKCDNILRGTLELPTSEDIPYTLTLLDDNFHDLPLNILKMSDSIVNSEYIDSVTIRHISFSLRIPKQIQTYTIVFNDESGAVRPNFAVLEPALYLGLLEEQHNVTLDAAHDPNYHSWFTKRMPSEADLKLQRETQFEISPLISIIVPLFHTPLEFFWDMINSVMAQTYENFELILVNADIKNKDLAVEVNNALQADSRIREVKRLENEGISLNTAAGISCARGEYLAFLDHDDTLEQSVLFKYVSAINDNRDIDLLYCDEDKLFPDGTYGDAYFKPRFSPFLLRNINYICHFLMIRRSIVLKMEPANPLYDGAQDHHMILQALEFGAHVHNVQEVLYHWRISEGSTASGTNSKPYADTAGKLVLERHLKKQGIAAQVFTTDNACRYDITYKVLGNPLVSIVIPSKDNIDILDTCIKSIIEKSTYNNYEIIIVENNSTEAPTFEYYKQLTTQDGRIRIITWEHEFNFSKIMNFGVEHAQGEYILLLNNDTEVISSSWIESMLGVCQINEVGAVGAKLYYKDKTIQHAGVYVQGTGAGHLNLNLDCSEHGYYNTAITTREVSAVTAACLLTSKAIYEAVGGFSTQFNVAFNDVDYCLKVREAGFLVIFTPQAELYHYESLSRGYETTIPKQIRFHREASLLNALWPKYYVLGDPFMNPNLDPNSRYYHLDDRDEN